MKITKRKRSQYKLITSECQALKELRLELNLSLEEAGKCFGLSAKGIGAIENGRVSLTKDRIKEIIKSYGLSYLDFIRAKRIIEKECHKKNKRCFTKTVLKNSDRRSYQKIITKECLVLKSMRRTRKISQDHASSLCGYPRASIGHIENGRIELTDDRIKHIIHSYGYRFSEFQENMKKENQRDNVIDSCLSKIEELDESKLELVKNLLGSL